MKKDGKADVFQKAMQSVCRRTSVRNFLGPLSLICEYLLYSCVPFTSFFFFDLPQAKAGCVVAWGWFQWCGTAAGPGGPKSQRMSLVFTISSVLTRLETHISRQAASVLDGLPLPL